LELFGYNLINLPKRSRPIYYFTLSMKLLADYVHDPEYAKISRKFLFETFGPKDLCLVEGALLKCQKPLSEEFKKVELDAKALGITFIILLSRVLSSLFHVLGAAIPASIPAHMRAVACDISFAPDLPICLVIFGDGTIKVIALRAEVIV